MHSAKKVIIKPMGQELATPTSSTLYKLTKREWQYLAISRRDNPMETVSPNQPLQKF
ncbi:MAG TPA: hypothetical protein QF700_10990 [Prochlorococcus sp.]|nr:hypothetical protein [Prochlorococcus sp.]